MKRLVPVPSESVKRLYEAREKEWGYQFVSVTLKDARHFEPAVASEGYIILVKGYRDVPFTADDIQSVEVSDKRWNFRRKTFDRAKLEFTG